MKMKKRILALLLAVLLAVGLTCLLYTSDAADER